MRKSVQSFIILFVLLVFNSCLSCEDNSEIRGSVCIVVAEDIVKQYLIHPNDAKFDSFSAKHESLGNNSYKVLEKFVAKNDFGVSTPYIYKIQLKYLGGDKYEESSWLCNELVIENMQTGEQQRIR